MSKPAVKPIPDGMHSLTPLLICAGAADAIKFYTKAFSAVEVSRLPGPKGNRETFIWLADPRSASAATAARDARKLDAMARAVEP